MTNFNYSMPFKGVCEINDHRDPTRRTRVNLESAQFALQNVKKTRDFYATEEAFQRMRSKYIGAINFLKENVHKEKKC